MAVDYKQYINGLNSAIPDADISAAALAKRRWDSIAKPLGSLGKLEEMVIKTAALTGGANVDISRRCVAMFCADNGVVAEGVTQTGSEVTAIVAANAAHGKSTVCAMARTVGAEVYPVDVGMLTRADGVADRHVADGTMNFTLGPAMTPEQAMRAIQAGIDAVKELAENNYRLIVTGEMGIGNTTTASAVAAVLTDTPIDEAVGRGAGLSDAGLMRKRSAIARGIAVNKPDKADAFDVLGKLGGFDMAAMAGAFIGGALYRVPTVIDGFISSAAALIAARLCPRCSIAMIPSHASAEPAAKRIMKELDLEPPLYADMRLGEGTGGVCIIPLMDMALSVYNTMATFEDINVDAYTPQGGEIK